MELSKRFSVGLPRIRAAAFCVAGLALFPFDVVMAEDVAKPLTEDADQVQFFESQIRPLLANHCWKCHSEKSQKGGARLDSIGAMLRGGESGPSLVVGKPDESLLIEAVRYEGYEMPPSGPLKQEQVEVLETWVRMGAYWPGDHSDEMRPTDEGTEGQFTEADRQWWAVASLSKPDVPTAAGKKWARNAIDHFVAEKLDEKQLSPAPEASKETLIRRLCFDLTGLPPTSQQIERFVNDESERAYEQLVDRLLDSQAYGERFARHWLDVVRYADSDGYRADHTRPNAWRYRDYVIDSLNHDKPYDKFVKEQLAGDELYPQDPSARIATGFLTHGIYEYNSRDVVGQWDIMLNEVTDAIGDVFLGVGMQCSRCHDHKFDPILQRDYFALRAFVEPILIDRDAICATAKQIEDHAAALAVWETKTESLRQQLAEKESKYRDKAKDIAVIKFPKSIQEMMKTPVEERSPREHQYAELAHRQVEFEYERMDTHFSKEDKESILALRREIQKFDHLKPSSLPTAQMVRNNGALAPKTVIPKKRTEVDPGFLSILTPDDASVRQPRRVDSESGQATELNAIGRRSELANWIASPDNPLSTRVIVNRVWQWHFGSGLAPNASDFGFLGGSPSHPELLDWLTTKFINDGWRFKPLHRLIVTSATYRQSSVHPDSERLMQVDPRNRWHWRGNVRRLDAEQIRDAILALSGVLDDRPGGSASSDDKHRRAIYTVVKRNSRNPLLDAFDLPLFFGSTASRDTTTNPLQSLMLINSQAMLDHAKQLASKVDVGVEDETVSNLWRLSYGRLPSDGELEGCKQFIASQRKLYTKEMSDSKSSVETSTLPYRDAAAVVIKPGSPTQLRSLPHESLSADEFTVEAIFQLSSIYQTGSVRSIVSTWSGNQGTPGWTFGVTGKGSRRKPQTLVLHAFGSDGKKTVTEAAIFSDQHIDLGKPYYAAATVKLASEEGPGKVTFYLKDLSDEEQPISTTTMDHQLVGGLTGDSGVAIGGRVEGSGSMFDGLVDDVRLSLGQLPVEQLLLNSDQLDATTIALWRFEPSAGLDRDLSPAGIHLERELKPDPASTPYRRALVDLCHVLLNSSEFLYVR